MLQKVTKIPYYPNAILFDWDNTIVDVNHIIKGALDKTCNKFDVVMPIIKDYNGPRKVFFKKYFGVYNLQASNYFTEQLSMVSPVRENIFSNVVQVLELIKKNNIHCSLVSNKQGDILRKEVKFFKLEKYFNRIIGSGDAVNDKPEADPILLAMAGQGIDINKFVYYVGDSIVDYMCAMNCGVTPIMYGVKITENTEGIDTKTIHVNDHFELYQIINNSLNNEY